MFTSPCTVTIIYIPGNLLSIDAIHGIASYLVSTNLPKMYLSIFKFGTCIYATQLGKISHLEDYYGSFI